MDESRKKLNVTEKQAYVLDTYKDDPLLLYIIDRQAQDIFLKYAQDFFENVELDKYYTNNTATQLLGFKYSQKILNMLNDSKYSNYLKPFKKGNQYRHNIEILFKLLLITFLSESLLLNAPDISTILGEDDTYTSLNDDSERQNNSSRQNINPSFLKGLIEQELKESKMQMQDGFKNFVEELERRTQVKDQSYLKMQSTLLDHITYNDEINRKELELVQEKSKVNQIRTELNYLESFIRTEERQLAENKRTIAVLVDREQETAQQASLNKKEEMTVNIPVVSGKKYIPRFLKNFLFIEEGEDLQEQTVKITKEIDKVEVEQIKDRQANLLKHIEDLTLEQGNITASIENSKTHKTKLSDELQQALDTVKQLEEQLQGLKSNKSIETLKNQLNMPSKE
ncbi:hypothetical protein [Lysinibacillus sp. OL1]|uniref:hypothetical protein n=1 Tax=Lysinibacillus sp. OL1 TaxID=2517243 RepID=UPI00103CD228|nr:hypothetical protein [Lysinibacillus sp. OL1]TBV85450.1 hypothetical protein EW028_21090 [Lysinibacillus sp. OL1]